MFFFLDEKELKNQDWNKFDGNFSSYTKTLQFSSGVKSFLTHSSRNFCFVKFIMSERTNNKWVINYNKSLSWFRFPSKPEWQL